MKIQIYCVILALSLIFQPVKAFADARQMVEITIVQKDYLINICKKYLEHPEQWPTIAKLNHLANPDLILPGQVLKVPAEMLKGTPVDGVVTFLKGTVTAKASEQADWQALHLKDAISVGSGIKTAQESTVEISFADGTVLLMKPNTALNVSTSKMNLTQVIRRINLQTGKLVSRIKSATGRENRYEIQTPSSLAAARGTEYRVSVDEQQATRAEVLEGIVDVSAMGTKVVLNRDEGTLVRMNAPPAQPAKLLPPPDVIGLESLYRALPLAVQFAKVEGAAAYNVVLTKDPAAKDIVREQVVRPGEKFEVSDVVDGVYFLTSLSIDANGLEGRQSSPAEIRVRISPVQPLIRSPLDNALLRTKQVEFSWLRVQNAAAYHLQIAQDSEFRKIAREAATIKESSYMIDNLPPGPYYYRLRALAEDGFAGEWAAAQRFNIVAPPAVPEVEIPVVDGKETHIKWSSVGEGVTYQVQVAREEGFKEIIMDKKMGQAEITLANLQDSGRYYVRIRGIDKENYAGEFSAPRSFTHKTSFPLELLGVLGVILLIVL